MALKVGIGKHELYNENMRIIPTISQKEPIKEIFPAQNTIKVPTTFEMDGLFTQQDIDNRHITMCQCSHCNEWSRWDREKEERWKCPTCGGEEYDHNGSKSIRTWLVTKDLKKKRVKKSDARA